MSPSTALKCALGLLWTLQATTSHCANNQEACVANDVVSMLQISSAATQRAPFAQFAQPATSQISVRVPAGAKVGDSIQATSPDGQTLQFTMPAEAKIGDLVPVLYTHLQQPQQAPNPVAALEQPVVMMDSSSTENEFQIAAAKADRDAERTVAMQNAAVKNVMSDYATMAQFGDSDMPQMASYFKAEDSQKQADWETMADVQAAQAEASTVMAAVKPVAKPQRESALDVKRKTSIEDMQKLAEARSQDPPKWQIEPPHAMQQSILQTGAVVSSKEQSDFMPGFEVKQLDEFAPLPAMSAQPADNLLSAGSTLSASPVQGQVSAELLEKEENGDGCEGDGYKCCGPGFFGKMRSGDVRICVKASQCWFYTGPDLAITPGTYDHKTDCTPGLPYFDCASMVQSTSTGGFGRGNKCSQWNQVKCSVPSKAVGVGVGCDGSLVPVAMVPWCRVPWTGVGCDGPSVDVGTVCESAPSNDPDIICDDPGKCSAGTGTFPGTGTCAPCQGLTVDREQCEATGHCKWISGADPKICQPDVCGKFGDPQACRAQQQRATQNAQIAAEAAEQRAEGAAQAPKENEAVDQPNIGEVAAAALQSGSAGPVETAPIDTPALSTPEQVAAAEPAADKATGPE